MRVLLAFLAIVALVQPHPARSYTILDGNILHQWCSADATNLDKMMGISCIGYIRGIFERKFVDLVLKGRQDCIRKSVNNDQIIDIVKVYLRDHPEHRDNFAALIVENAILDKFPACQD